MSIHDLKDDYYGLTGSRSHAATTCLLRYFHVLKIAKASLRAKLSEADLYEIAAVAVEIPLRGNVDADLTQMRDRLPGEVSETCGEKLAAISDIESVALLDAVERTQNLHKGPARSLVGPRLLL